MSTSDFQIILAGVVHKNFNAAYSQENRNFEGIAARRIVAYFRPVREIQLSSFSLLEKQPEGAEIRYGVLSEGEESWGIASYGKGLRITRQAPTRP